MLRRVAILLASLVLAFGLSAPAAIPAQAFHIGPIGCDDSGAISRTVGDWVEPASWYNINRVEAKFDLSGDSAVSYFVPCDWHPGYIQNASQDGSMVQVLLAPGYGEPGYGDWNDAVLLGIIRCRAMSLSDPYSTNEWDQMMGGPCGRYDSGGVPTPRFFLYAGYCNGYLVQDLGPATFGPHTLRINRSPSQARFNIRIDGTIVEYVYYNHPYIKCWASSSNNTRGWAGTETWDRGDVVGSSQYKTLIYDWKYIQNEDGVVRDWTPFPTITNQSSTHPLSKSSGQNYIQVWNTW